MDSHSNMDYSLIPWLEERIAKDRPGDWPVRENLIQLLRELQNDREMEREMEKAEKTQTD